MTPNDKPRLMDYQLADQLDEPFLHGCKVRYFLLAAGVMHSAMAAIFAKMSEESLRLAFSTASTTKGWEPESGEQTKRPNVQSEVIDLSVKRNPQDSICIERLQPDVLPPVIPPPLPPCLSTASVVLASSMMAIKTPKERNSWCEKLDRNISQLQRQSQSDFFPVVPGYSPLRQSQSDFFPVVPGYSPLVPRIPTNRPFSMPTSSDEEFICKVAGCEKKFRSHNSLVNHHRIHTGERPFACDFPGCWQAFARQSNLITHRLVHLDREMRRKFICPVGGCGRNFLKKTNLEDHLNLHLGRRPYKCEHPGCGKAFRCRSNLSGHRRVHLRSKEAGQSNQSSALEKRIELILARAVDGPDGQQSPL
ncbi:unnamed protein product [Schistocephalus solidus]|uniref:Zinc finger protein n=1 Tax=Schistocephalus solidus TaxID=70667 RepID=A0A183TRA9_SCHSO|nr:unnamed protein product [Schistocephalus solidus]